MSVIDDSRVLLQDIVTPDLKAIASRLDALEKSVKQGFDSVEKIAEVRHELLLNKLLSESAAINNRLTAETAAINSRLTSEIGGLTSKLTSETAAINNRLSGEVSSLNAKFDALSNRLDREAIAAKERHESLLRSLDIDRRIELLESRNAPAKRKSA